MPNIFPSVLFPGLLFQACILLARLLCMTPSKACMLLLPGTVRAYSSGAGSQQAFSVLGYLRWNRFGFFLLLFSF